MGWRYFGFRLWFEFQKKTGLLERRFPVDGKYVLNYDLAEWIINPPPFVISAKAKLNWTKNPDAELSAKASKIRLDELPYFSTSWKKTTGPDKWHINPDNNYVFPAETHWTHIPDLSPVSGDIKFVWERSRFSWLYTLILSDFHNDEDHGAWIFDEIVYWILKNPINKGPNWRCSQEMSLRVFNWTYALVYYAGHTSLTNARFQLIMQHLYWHLHHIYENIQFSRIAVRNNHAITETAALMLSEQLFPFIPATKKWGKMGRKWFEEEINYQIYPDGTYLQFSHNYHRVVVQLLTLVIAVTEKAGKPLSNCIYDRAYKSLDFLYQCQAGKGGELPNYGANDGALFFPLSWKSDYRDYRPQLNSLHLLLTGAHLYAEKGDWKVDAIHWGIEESKDRRFSPLKPTLGWHQFPIGGFYIWREVDTLSFIRCGNHRDRPSQADNLHLDIWYKGENYLIDAGTYKYNAAPKEVLYFSGTASHNTVMVNGENQMPKGPRFIWLDWSQSVNVSCRQTEDSSIFEGEILAFKQLGNITHKRIIKKKLNAPHWEITDVVIGNGVHETKQIWHFHSELAEKIELQSDFPIERSNGWQSSYYGTKLKSVTNTIKSTQAEIKTWITIND